MDRPPIPLNDPLLDPPPAPKSRVWVWILSILACLICGMVVALGGPIGGVLLLATQTAVVGTSQAGATQTSAYAAAQPPASWVKVIGDPFDNNLNLWRVENFSFANTSIVSQVTGGRYVYHILHDDQAVVRTEWPQQFVNTRPDRLFLAVDVRQIDGSPTENDSGLVFHYKNTGEFAVFGITNSQNFSVFTLHNSQWSETIPWTVSPWIKPDDFNRLVVVTDDTGYMFLINGHYAGHIANLAIEPGRVGIYTSGSAPSGVTFEFDNFQLYTPPAK